MMLGAYAVWSLTVGVNLPLWLAIPLAFVCAIAYGWLIERLFFERLVGESVFSMVMVTIGLVILIRGVVLVVWGAADKSFPVLLPPAPLIVGEMIFPSNLVIGAVLTMVVTVAVSWFFNSTRTGLTLTAVAEEPSTAISLGISVKRAVTLAWMMGSVIATAGAIVLLSGRSITVQTADVALAALVAAYLDPMIGGAASSIVPFVFMLLILLVRPTGLFGWRHVERV
jgi:branched-chain amino acid transport system permease protein